jgi:hypothetical protein
VTPCADTAIDFHNPAHEPQAVALCNTCPRKLQCAQDGLEEPYGVWGGTTPRQRGFRQRGDHIKREPRNLTSVRHAVTTHRKWWSSADLAVFLGINEMTARRWLVQLEADSVVVGDRNTARHMWKAT